MICFRKAWSWFACSNRLKYILFWAVNWRTKSLCSKFELLLKNEKWIFRYSSDCAWWSRRCSELFGWHASSIQITSSKMRQTACSENPCGLSRRSIICGFNVFTIACGFNTMLWLYGVCSYLTAMLLKVTWAFLPANGYGRLLFWLSDSLKYGVGE